MNKTLHFFKEIAKIPRESGNEANIAKYLVRFAKERNLFYFEDEYHNVIIKKVDKRFSLPHFTGSYGYGVCK